MSDTTYTMPNALTKRALKSALEGDGLTVFYKPPSVSRSELPKFRSALRAVFNQVQSPLGPTISDCAQTVVNHEMCSAEMPQCTARDVDSWQNTESRGSKRWIQLGILRDFYEHVDLVRFGGAVPEGGSVVDETTEYVVRDPEFNLTDVMSRLTRIEDQLTRL